MNIGLRHIKYIALLPLLWACTTSPNFSEIPELSFVGLSKNSMVQGSTNSDSLTIFLEFQDGDGDIGYDSETTNVTNLFLIDTRINDTVERFKTPIVPLEGAQSGIRGEISISIFTTCCIFPEGFLPCQSPDEFPTNDLTYDIILVDRAGNESNKVTTSTINLLCN